MGTCYLVGVIRWFATSRTIAVNFVAIGVVTRIWNYSIFDLIRKQKVF